MGTIPFVDLRSQYQEIAEDVERDVLHVLRTCQFVGGPYLDRFEKALSDYLGVRHVVGVSNGTDAIMLACEALGLGRNDCVIIPNNSFIASAFGVSRAGAKPIVVDVDPNTYLLDFEQVRAACKRNKRVKAVLAVDLYGQMPNLEQLSDFCKESRLFLIEDAAQAVGATYRKGHVGQWSDVATTSFYPAKNLGGVGQGGAVITNNSTVAGNVRIIANQGSESKYEHICVGGNYRLDSIMAAHLYHALNALDRWNARRRKIAQIYNEGFTADQRPTQQPNGRHIYHLYEFKCRDGTQRADVQRALDYARIFHGLHYPNLISDLSAYSTNPGGGWAALETPVALDLKSRLLSLPIFPSMTEEQAKSVVDVVNTACESVIDVQV